MTAGRSDVGSGRPGDDPHSGDGLEEDTETERPWTVPGSAAGPSQRSAHPRRVPHGPGAGPGRGGSNRLLTAGEVAEWFGVSETTVRNRYRSWGLKPQKIGRLLRFRERDLRAWLDAYHG
ncbi:helix-turn-helix domain-containing protein [Streptomyces sp. NPDC006990]|uniref:helix-turn-helix domain-containing protein n=1 Tax=Streptomyces sp. NPDC006990 TaxID=3154481 RepID=UPI0034522492